MTTQPQSTQSDRLAAFLTGHHQPAITARFEAWKDADNDTDAQPLLAALSAVTARVMAHVANGDPSDAGSVIFVALLETVAAGWLAREAEYDYQERNERTAAE